VPSKAPGSQAFETFGTVVAVNPKISVVHLRKEMLLHQPKKKNYYSAHHPNHSFYSTL
jgi:hypothetical protein